MEGDFRVVISLEAVGEFATASLQRHEERFAANDLVSYKNAKATYDFLLTALNTMEGFSE